MSSRPLVGVTGRLLGPGRVTGWSTGGLGVTEEYLTALERAGGFPLTLHPTALGENEEKALLESFDALVLTGGPDVDPARYGQDPHPSVYGTDPLSDDFEIRLTLAALDIDMPLLAICRGIQVLNVALGGSLDQHITDRDGIVGHGIPAQDGGAEMHTVHVEPDSLLASVLENSTPRCSCHHHQALGRVGDGLQVVAQSEDGIVEGVEVTGSFVLAVQWHPEDTAEHDPVQQRLFDALVATAANRYG